MPDVWTLNPEKLRTMLESADIECGVEPRVLRDRDPEWTCHIDRPGWIADVYIHDARSPWDSPLVFWLGIAILLVGLTIGVLVGKRIGVE